MKQLDPKAVWVFFLKFTFQAIALSLALLFVFPTLKSNNICFIMSKMNFLPCFLALLLILILSYIWAKLTYHCYRYELAENSFREERGVIYKKYSSIPYERIQNIDIYRGILARLLGLSDLSIQTAGGSASGPECRLSYLSKETAEALREELIQRARSHKNQGV